MVHVYINYYVKWYFWELLSFFSHLVRSILHVLSARRQKTCESKQLTLYNNYLGQRILLYIANIQESPTPIRDRSRIYCILSWIQVSLIFKCLIPQLTCGLFSKRSIYQKLQVQNESHGQNDWTRCVQKVLSFFLLPYTFPALPFFNRLNL